ncbi:MAG TPA: dihydrodipicolinate synthase family protein, partial [Chloroflexota bacterium]|nr:dihydrodipicolinate synthase family protein [Chloroflexota bacterium]
DREGVKKHIDFVVNAGVDGIFILGSIGEGPFVRPHVAAAMAEATVEAVAGRVPVIAGVIEPSTARTIDAVKNLSGRGLAGYVAAAPFYYGGYVNRELDKHFRKIADAADLPVLLYNIPVNTKTPMNANLILGLQNHPNIAGIKDSSGDWPVIQPVLLNKEKDFVFFQGNQYMCAVSLMMGADGLVPGHANVWPKLVVDLMKAGKERDFKAAFALQNTLDKLVTLRGRAPAYTYKIVTKALGLTDEYVSTPLPMLTPEETDAFIKTSIELGVPIPRE